MKTNQQSQTKQKSTPSSLQDLRWGNFGFCQLYQSKIFTLNSEVSGSVHTPSIHTNVERLSLGHTSVFNKLLKQYLLLPVRREDLPGLVVAGQAVDSALHQNQAEFSVTVLQRSENRPPAFYFAAFNKRSWLYKMPDLEQPVHKNETKVHVSRQGRHNSNLAV